MKLRLAITFLSIAFLTNGCSSFSSIFEKSPRAVADSADIANVFVTALPPMLFSDLQESLAVQHGLSAADCRTLASQTTRSDIYQLLSQVSLGIGLSLPTLTASNTTSTENGVTSLTNTRTTGSATVPSSSGVASNAMAESSLSPDIAKAAQSFGMDGEAAILGGTALCQAAAIAQQQITSVKLPSGYDAHVITFQVNVQPKARDLSYDTYINLELWSGESSKITVGGRSEWELPPVMVYPLIINDVLESTSTARTAEVVRQFSAALSGVMGNLGAINTGYNNSQSQMNAVLGADRNSILTMGRITDNTIKIRLGAPNAGSNQYAMVARTFNVSTLVLTKKPSEGETGNLVAYSSSTFKSTDPKADDPQNTQGRLDTAKKIAEILDGYPEFKLSEADVCGGYLSKDKATLQAQVTKSSMVPLLDILRGIDRQDFTYLNNCIIPAESTNKCDDACKKTREALLQITRIRMYSDISHVRESIGSSTNTIPIPYDKTTALPDAVNQLIVVEDDKKEYAFAVLRGGKNLSSKALAAYAIVDPSLCGFTPAENNECKLLASSISVSADGSAVTATFPSFSKLDLKPGALVLAKTNMGCEKKKNVEREKCEQGGISRFTKMRFPDNKLTPDVKLPTAKLTSGTRVVVADINGNGNIGLAVDMKNIIDADKKAKKEDRLLPIFLEISGANVVSVNGSVFSASAKGILIAQSGTANVALGNLAPGQFITVRVVDSSREKELSSPLTFFVDRATHK